MASKGIFVADAGLGHPELDLPVGLRNQKRGNSKASRALWRCLAGAAAYLVLSNLWLKGFTNTAPRTSIVYTPEVLARCQSLNLKPCPPANFQSRTTSDRFQEGTRATLITNAKAWTGNEDGTHVMDCADILLDQGLVKWIGNCGKSEFVSGEYGSELLILDAKGAWLTPGYV